MLIGVGAFAVRGRSGDAVKVEWPFGSGKIEPSRAATLPRLLLLLLSDVPLLCSSPAVPVCRSGLALGLGARLPGRRASFNLRPGEGERFPESSGGACRELVAKAGATSEAARLPDCSANVWREEVPSSWSSITRFRAGSVVE